MSKFNVNKLTLAYYEYQYMAVVIFKSFAPAVLSKLSQFILETPPGEHGGPSNFLFVAANYGPINL
jgi:hypothetical protein